MFGKHQRHDTIHGILFVMLFSLSALYIAEIPFINNLHLAAPIIGIVLGIGYANSLRSRIPPTWVNGILFSSKKLLRLGVILYGFRITVQEVISVGWQTILIDAIIIVSTLYLGIFVGKLLKLDAKITLLTSIGSAICGGAAILGAEPVIKARPYKATVAISTVVIFGTLAMFLYTILFSAYYDGNSALGMTLNQWGIFSGATLHEVAHAVGVGEGLKGVAGVDDIANTVVIAKMIRVILLAPLLVIFALLAKRHAMRKGNGKVVEKTKISIPWFAIWFIVAILVYSADKEYTQVLTPEILKGVQYVCTFLLTMAMTALGMETNFQKMKKTGAKPFILATVLFAWLLVGGYILTKIFIK